MAQSQFMEPPVPQPRLQGTVVSIGSNYGFVVVGGNTADATLPRYFFHNTQVVGCAASVRMGYPVTFALADSGRGDGKECAVQICDAANQPIPFTRGAAVDMRVSAPGRRVGIVNQNTRLDSKFCFVLDQETGERVFVPIPLPRGQQIEFTRELNEKGPKAANITGPVGAPLNKMPRMMPNNMPQQPQGDGGMGHEYVMGSQFHPQASPFQSF